MQEFNDNATGLEHKWVLGWIYAQGPQVVRLRRRITSWKNNEIKEDQLHLIRF